MQGLGFLSAESHPRHRGGAPPVSPFMARKRPSVCCIDPQSMTTSMILKSIEYICQPMSWWLTGAFDRLFCRFAGPFLSAWLWFSRHSPARAMRLCLCGRPVWSGNARADRPGNQTKALPVRLSALSAPWFLRRFKARYDATTGAETWIINSGTYENFGTVKKIITAVTLCK